MHKVNTQEEATKQQQQSIRSCPTKWNVIEYTTAVTLYSNYAVVYIAVQVTIQTT